MNRDNSRVQNNRSANSRHPRLRNVNSDLRTGVLHRNKVVIAGRDRTGKRSEAGVAINNPDLPVETHHKQRRIHADPD
jgi:hypothetical protein